MRKKSTSTEVLETHSSGQFDSAVRRATELLRAGEVVALPTETVYGLAANALHAQAVQRIFQIKGRPARNPIIVHVSSVAMARQCVRHWPELAGKLARAFWPGPLTLVLERSELIPDVVTAGGQTVGVRWPNHPFMQAVIRACAFPLAAPSANLANRVSPTNAEHVRKQLGGRIPVIVDGGPSPIGIESTVLDLSVRPPRLLRPGMIHNHALAAVAGELAVGADSATAILKSPGRLPKHYAPKARLALWSWSDHTELKRRSAGCGVRPAKTYVIAHTRIPSGKGFGGVSVIAHDVGAFGRAIYAELHRADDAGAELIVVEALPPGDEWEAIADRLNRAAA